MMNVNPGILIMATMFAFVFLIMLGSIAAGLQQIAKAIRSGPPSETKTVVNYLRGSQQGNDLREAFIRACKALEKMSKSN
jgi:hypothetical protein